MAQCDCKVVCLELIPSAELVDEQPKNLQEHHLHVCHKLHEHTVVPVLHAHHHVCAMHLDDKNAAYIHEQKEHLLLSQLVCVGPTRLARLKIVLLSYKESLYAVSCTQTQMQGCMSCTTGQLLGRLQATIDCEPHLWALAEAETGQWT